MADDADSTERQLNNLDTAAPTLDVSPRGDDDRDDETLDAPAEVGPDRRGHQARLLLGALLAVTLTALTSWLGWQFLAQRSQQQHHEVLLQAARQGAINLTTIDYREADTDIQRILQGSTGAFHDDFQLRSKPFIETVKQAQSTSVGTITAAALESSTDHEAQALVAVTVKTSLAGVEQPEPRAWRMRINVENVGSEAKVSNVTFVP
jgi:Mce-associated membrane protein